MLAEPNLAGDYFSEADYAQLYKIAPNIQAALERLETTATNVKKELHNCPAINRTESVGWRW
jgi:hypothetical protein